MVKLTLKFLSFFFTDKISKLITNFFKLKPDNKIWKNTKFANGLLKKNANVITECPHRTVKKKLKTGHIYKQWLYKGDEIFKGDIDFQNTEQTENRENTEKRIKLFFHIKTYWTK